MKHAKSYPPTVQVQGWDYPAVGSWWAPQLCTPAWPGQVWAC